MLKMISFSLLSIVYILISFMLLFTSFISFQLLLASFIDRNQPIAQRLSRKPPQVYYSTTFYSFKNPTIIGNGELYQTKPLSYIILINNYYYQHPWFPSVVIMRYERFNFKWWMIHLKASSNPRKQATKVI